MNNANVATLKMAIKEACMTTEKEAGLGTAIRGMFKNKAMAIKSVEKANKYKRKFTKLEKLNEKSIRQLRNSKRLGLAKGIGGAVIGGGIVKHRAKAKAEDLGNNLQASIANMSVGDRMRLSAGLMFKPGQVGAGINSQIQQLMNNM